jgi:CubicO group peptidase (beta-lactamase class C family)
MFRINIQRVTLLLVGLFLCQSLTAENKPFPAEFETFADGVFATIMQEEKIAGATFSVVRNGEIIINKGYGFADVANGLPVDPNKTLFRIGSISKLFVWISAMQMVEQGKLELDRDINDYLTDFKIPATFSEPVTLRSLLTHTPGFEDKLYRLFVLNADEMHPINEVLASQVPLRVRPPMQQASYSNHGTGIAQHLVEIASGMDFITYCKEHILKPLGMHNTTLHQPIPEYLSTQMSKGYAYVNGRYVERPFEFVPLQGVGGMSTTAADMALFMKALLNNSCLDSFCLLGQSTYDMMLAPAFSHADGISHSMLGFMNMARNGNEAFGHGGNTFYFHSRLTLIPGENIGYFYSFNTESGAMPSSKVSELLFDRFFPDERLLKPAISLDEGWLKMFEGSYRFNRFPHSDLFKMVAFMNSASIKAEDGQLGLTMMGETIWGVPVDSLIFRKENSNELMVFTLDHKGRVENLYLGGLTIMALNKNTGIWNPQLHMSFLAMLLFVMLYVLVYWPWLYFVKRRIAPVNHTKASLPVIAKVLAAITAACYLLFFVLLIAGSPPGPDLVFGIPAMVKAALIFPLLAIPFTLGVAWQSISLINAKNIRLCSRLFYWFTLTVFLVAIWLFNFWKLLGWNY